MSQSDSGCLGCVASSLLVVLLMGLKLGMIAAIVWVIVWTLRALGVL